MITIRCPFNFLTIASAIILSTSCSKSGNTPNSSQDTILSLPKTWQVSTIAGIGSAGKEDGPIAGAQFNQPSRIALDTFDNLFVVDNYKLIRKVSNGLVTTYAEEGVTDGNLS